MGLIHIYCGDGKGKTTAATGLSMRMLGFGKKVLFVQFFKDGTSNEITALRTFPNLTYKKAERVFGRFSNMTESQKIQSHTSFNNVLSEVFSTSGDYDLIVLDEIISAINYGFIDINSLINFCKDKKDNLEIVLTGRNPDERLIEMADYVSEMKKIKHPFDRNIFAREGIEF